MGNCAGAADMVFSLVCYSCGARGRCPHPAAGWFVGIQCCVKGCEAGDHWGSGITPMRARMSKTGLALLKV